MAKRPTRKSADNTLRKKRFDAAHAAGMDALRRGDFDALGEAIRREEAVIDEQGAALKRNKKPR